MKLNSFARFFGIRGNKKTKKPHRRHTARPKVETLEDRTLLSVIPAATVTNQRIVDGSAGLSSLYPNVAVDPMNPQKILEFHTTSVMSQPAPIDPEMVLNGNYSTDGGKSWFTMAPLFPLLDPATPSNDQFDLAPFAQMSSINVAWDKLGNAYLVMSEHSTDGSSGKLVLEGYNFSGSAPVQTITDSVIYSWRGAPTGPSRQDIAYNPVIAIDDNTPVFIDPDSTAVQPGLPPLQQTDTMANLLSRPDIGPSGIEVPKAFYVAFNINWQSEQGFINAGGAPQISGVMVAASDDGGRSFTTPEYVTGLSGEFGSPQASAPQLVFTQGTTALGFHNNDITTPGGQLSIFFPESPTWSLGNDRSFSQLMVSSSLPDGGSATGAAGVGDTFSRSWGINDPNGTIVDAQVAPGGSKAVMTPFSIPVNITDPNFTTLSDVSVTVNLVDTTMDQLRLTLVPPSGSGLPSIPLLLNHDNPDGTTNKGIGLDSGANLGEQTTKVGPLPVTYITPVGTTFDSTIAVRTLRDQTATNQPSGDAHIGYYLPEGGFLSDYFGATKAQLNGTWTLEITDNVNNGTQPPHNYVDNWSIDFTSNMSTTGVGTPIPVPLPTAGVGTPLHGSTTSVYPTALPAAGTAGASPGYVVAVDNTLGIHSPYAGRMYLAYVGKGPQPNQTTAPLNTDIFLVYSDDGGVTWSAPLTVNDDGSATDGFSSGLRAQWMPSLTVDQATGAVVVSYYDTRWDPSQMRSANYLTVSIDGGQTFNQSVFLNQASTATNMINGATDVIAPIPGNAPQTNPSLGFGFGDRQGLVAWDGHVYDFFTSNINESFNLTSVSPDFIPLNYTGTEVMTADVTYAAGPRIIAGDEGPVTLTSTYAGEPTPVFAADGRRELTGFSVTFDRPVFIPSFTPDQVTVLYRSPTTPLTQPGTPVAVSAILPVHPDWSGQMATTFFIQLATPQSAPGTYSYTVGPQISDRVWSARFDDNNSTNLAVNGSFELPANDPGTSQTYASIPGWFLASGPNFDVQNNTYGPAADGNQWLELGDAAGLRSVYQDIPTVAGQTYQVSFWFSPTPGTPQSANDMAVMWNGSQVANVSADGTTLTTTGWQQYVYTLKATGPTTRLEFVGKGSVNGAVPTFGNTELDGVNVVPVSTNPMDQNANGLAGETNYDQFSMPQPINGVPFQIPYNTATEPLIIPGPYVRVQTTNPQTSGSYVAGQAATTIDNVVMNTTASSINVRFDRQMAPGSFTPAAILRMTGPLGTITGPFTVTPVYAKLGDTTTDTFQIGFPKQTLSGQYTITLAPTMKDTAGNLVDTNQNAGLYTLNGFDPTSLSYASSTYQLNNLSVTIPAGKTVASTISVADAFKILQNKSNPIMAQLSITDANDPDLSAQLIAPDGTVIQLFSNVGGFGSPSHANFSSTTFSDFATTPIQLGTPPFDTGPYDPQQPLSALL
ncbi:MAG TPA: DUF642 domain-containing protein, partial [Gemmataceae bacterium]|nr:DUF642 domain-containing protein [Gemmataceae bacterium]